MGNMTEVNKTLYIPLYGKSLVSKQHIILDDPDAERILRNETVAFRRKSKSKWLAYNMAMRARVFDDWTDNMLQQNEDSVVLHIGCGLDSRCHRIQQQYREWIDCDLPEVISLRRQYYQETDCYHMQELDASDPDQIAGLPGGGTVIIVLEGLSMYLTGDQLNGFFRAVQDKYRKVHILMDIYTVLGAKASKYRNPVNDVGVTELHGIDDIGSVLSGLDIHMIAEHSFTPAYLVNELKPADRIIFRILFTGRLYSRIYRLIELGS